MPDDAITDGQAESGPFEFRLGGKKRLEDTVLVQRIDTDPVILDDERDARLLRFRADADNSPAFTGIKARNMGFQLVPC